MTYFPRVRPVLGLAAWCAFALAAFIATTVGMMLGTLVASVVLG
jgi:uncharacterized membrane protein